MPFLPILLTEREAARTLNLSLTAFARWCEDHQIRPCARAADGEPLYDERLQAGVPGAPPAILLTRVQAAWRLRCSLEQCDRWVATHAVAAVAMTLRGGYLYREADITPTAAPERGP